MKNGIKVGLIVDDTDCAHVGEYRLVKRLGSGTYGSVFAARHERNNRMYAMKRVDAFPDGMHAENEARTLQSLHHPHIVQLHQVLNSHGALYLVMELVDGGSLHRMITSSGPLDETTARTFFQQLISVIAYCHAKHVYHRDLKADNILCSKSGIKVCDFGCSHHSCAEADTDDACLVGSLVYSPPEMLDSMSSSVVDEGQADVWAAGVILYFMLVGKLPFRGRSEAEVEHLIERGEYDVAAVVQAGARRVVTQLLARHKSQRMTINDLLNDEWFCTDLDPVLFPSGQPAKGIRVDSTSSFSRSTTPTCEDSRHSTPAMIDHLTPMQHVRDAFAVVDVARRGFVTVEDWVSAFQRATVEIPRDDISEFAAALAPCSAASIDDFVEAVTARDIFLRHPAGMRVAEVLGLQGFANRRRGSAFEIQGCILGTPLKSVVEIIDDVGHDIAVVRTESTVGGQRIDLRRQATSGCDISVYLQDIAEQYTLVTIRHQGGSREEYSVGLQALASNFEQHRVMALRNSCAIGESELI